MPGSPSSASTAIRGRALSPHRRLFSLEHRWGERARDIVARTLSRPRARLASACGDLLISCAVATTSAAACGIRFVCRRVTGEEIPTEATISPCDRGSAPRCSAVFDVLGIVERESLDANPPAHTAKRRQRGDRVARVGAQRAAKKLLSALRSKSASSALPCAVQWSGANSPVCPAGDHLASRDVMVDKEHLTALAHAKCDVSPSFVVQIAQC